MSECFYHSGDSQRLRDLRADRFESFVEFDSTVFAARALPVKELIAVGHSLAAFTAA